MKNINLTITLILMFCNVYNSQNIDSTELFNKLDIEFQLVQYGIKFTSDSTITGGTMNIIVDGYEKEKQYLKEADKQTIIKLLEKDETGWIVNLLLYDIYKKRAGIFYAFDIRTKEDWKGFFEEEDINYWKKNLK